MSSANASASTVKNRPVHSTGEYSRPRAETGVVFNKIQFGLWRAETETHSLEIRLNTSSKGHVGYIGQLLARPATGRLAYIKCQRFSDCEDALKKALAEQTKPKLESPARIRALATFEDYADEPDVERKLERRAEVYLKRWNLIALSKKYSRASINNRATVILTICTEAAS